MTQLCFRDAGRNLVRFVFALLFLFNCVAQADPFRNLNFEEANTNSLSMEGFEYYGPAADLLSGWDLFFGGVLVTNLGFNQTDLAFNQNGATIRSSEPPYEFLGNPIEGKFSLSVSTGLGFTTEQYTLVQRGDIPADAFFLKYTYGQKPFSVSINGTRVLGELGELDDMILGIPSRTVLLDISQFSGQNVELRFTTTARGLAATSGPHTLDDIAFVVPEPDASCLIILALGGWFLAARLRSNLHS